MFQDSLIESGGKLKTKRGVTTILSFSFQVTLVAVLILIPLLYTEALPKPRLMISVSPPPPPPPAATVKAIKIVQTDLVQGPLRTPTTIPKQVKMITEEEAPPTMTANGVVDGVQGGQNGGQKDGLISSIISSTPMAVPKGATQTRVRVSQGVTAGLLTRKVQPVYPPLARQACIQGAVVLQAEISKDGAIQNLSLVNGHPMLAPAAIEAVKQWRYRPYILNGEPLAETRITVNFTLSGG